MHLFIQVEEKKKASLLTATEWVLAFSSGHLQEEGRPLWTDGSAHNLTDALMSSLPANETDCFALQRNATGPGYFLTPFFCHIALPFICQYQSKCYYQIYC